MNKFKFIFIIRRFGYNHKISDAKGFTLVETLIAMAIFAVISIIVLSVFDTFQRGYTTQQVTLDVIQKVRSTLAFVASDIKQAGLDPRETDNFRVRTATATQFTFDFDTPDSTGLFDGKLDITNPARPERRTYMFSGGNMYQMDNIPDPANPRAPTAAELLIPGVDITNSLSRFEYIDKDRAVMPVPVAAANIRYIRAVRIVLTVNESSGRGSRLSRTMDTMVLCRNLLYDDNRSKQN